MTTTTITFDAAMIYVIYSVTANSDVSSFVRNVLHFTELVKFVMLLKSLQSIVILYKCAAQILLHLLLS